MQLEHVMNNFSASDQLLSHLCPSGYLVAINVDSTTPEIFHCTYPETWWEEYRAKSYLLSDPTVQWGSANTGAVIWSDLISRPISIESQNMMVRAVDYGLCFGLTYVRNSMARNKKKSFFGGARPDRDFTSHEVDQLVDAFDNIASQVEVVPILTSEELQVLEAAATGLSYKETAQVVEKSVETVKLRLSSARKTLCAKSTPQAIAIAHSRGLIVNHGNRRW